MISELRPALSLTLVFAALLGVAYPLGVTGAANALFPYQANGSLIDSNGEVTGSALVGQTFTQAGYFHGRPSAAGDGYNAASTGGSNLGPTSKVLVARITADAERIVAVNGGGRVPVDLVTTSGSGLDPHISPAAAFFQTSRIASARGAETAAINALVAEFTEDRWLGLIGEPRVNVLLTNRALDDRFPPASSTE